MQPGPLLIHPARPRIYIGLFAMASLALFLLWVTVASDLGLLWRVTLLLASAVSAFGARQLARSGQVTLELTDTVLQEADSGAILARVDEIVGVDRGALAFKPSNGFLLRLEKRNSWAWVPGIWWRRGRLVGVGGVVSAHQARLVAETISMRIAARDA